MTALELYTASLIEANKQNAPTFTIEQFNYRLNKVLLGFTNERYNMYAVNEQLSDDLRVLVRDYKYVADFEDTGDTITEFIKNNASDPYYVGVKVNTIGNFAEGDIVRFEGSSKEYTITSLGADFFLFTPRLYISDGNPGGGVPDATL